ncbi:MAG: glyoxylate/hydroxypyruvate reductase A [Beijerinckiaceae bacterium]
MVRVVPFVHSLPFEEEKAWIAAIEKAAPGIELRPLADLSAQDCARAEAAIVANPEPRALARLSSLRWVQSLWAGVERLIAEIPPEITIVRMTDPQLARTMGEAVLAWTFYLHRDMPLYARQQKARLWRQRDVKRPEDRCVGLLGLGRMGQEAARRLSGNGFDVIGWSRSPRDVAGIETFSGDAGLCQVLGRADILVVLLPLTAQTSGLLNAQRLAQMKYGAALINFARGAIVEEQALLARLDSGALDHAALDVFATEPLPEESRLWTHERVTVLPHISAPTSVSTASLIAAANLLAWFESGRVPDAIDRLRGY